MFMSVCVCVCPEFFGFSTTSACTIRERSLLALKLYPINVSSLCMLNSFYSTISFRCVNYSSCRVWSRFTFVNHSQFFLSSLVCQNHRIFFSDSLRIMTNDVLSKPSHFLQIIRPFLIVVLISFFLL